jgi:hypothetical protein
VPVELTKSSPFQHIADLDVGKFCFFFSAINRSGFGLCMSGQNNTAYAAAPELTAIKAKT